MNNIVYMTLKAYVICRSTIIYLPEYLGFNPGDVVKLTFYKLDDPKKVMSIVKRIIKTGNGRGCYIDRCCGVNKGDIVVVRIQPMLGDARGNTGVEIEEVFEEPFE